LLQGGALDRQIILRTEFLRDHEVVAGLCFMRVSDGGGADFKIALG